jgi:hypothetical protein
MVLHDFICDRCERIFEDLIHRPGKYVHLECGGFLEVTYRMRKPRPAQLPEAESVALYYSEKEKQVQYPGRNDQPVPERLRARGYEKVWLRSDQAIGKFEKEHQVVNERRHFNNGNGF